MQSKLINKKVGSVEIFELIGDLSGNFAPCCGQAIRQVLEENKARHILFNTQELYQLDHHGVKVILDNAMHTEKCVILVRDPYIAESLRLEDKKGIPILENLEACAFHFSREFAKVTGSESNALNDRRRFRRLETALPLVIQYQTKEKRPHTFFTVVTNLSEGGLYGRLIDSHSENELKELRIKETPVVRLRLCLDFRQILDLEGMVIHDQGREEGIGLEFIELEDTLRIKIRNWLDEKALLERKK